MPSASICLRVPGGSTTNVTSVRGSTPTYASMLERNTCWLAPSSETPSPGAFEIADGLDLMGREEAETADVTAREDGDRVTGVDAQDQGGGEVHVHVGLTGCERLLDPFRATLLDVLNVGEPFGVQQIFDDVLWRLADRRDLNQADGGRLQRRLGCPAERRIGRG